MIHCVNFLKRKEGEHTDTLENVLIADIAPVLIEFIGACLFGVEPNSTRSGLAHLFTLGVHQQGDRHCISVLAELLSDKLCTAEHV